MSRPKSPCRECADRNERCHFDCERYLAYVDENEARKEIIRQGKAKEFGRGDWLTDRQFAGRRLSMKSRVLKQHKK